MFTADWTTATTTLDSTGTYEIDISPAAHIKYMIATRNRVAIDG